jgi:lipopolysaccharide/colanic/teichoic acid biosynthesis glycosyltransferase
MSSEPTAAPPRRDSAAYRIMKRAIDLSVALVALVFGSPFLLVAAVMIKIDSPGPVVFSQRRIGRGGRIFSLYKLRSMVDRRESDGQLLADGKRLTRVGRILRATSLDELPQLVNVIKGDMSLVGPRPLLPEYLERYSARQARRHEVEQGITGWAQINGRNAIGWEEKFDLDVWYVDHRSLGLDCRIVLMTMARVVRREGISSAGEATMSPFMGSDGADVNRSDLGEAT